MRAFLAFEVQASVKRHLQDVAKGMAARITGVKWVSEEGQHVTLKFFGEIGEDMAASIKASLARLEQRHRPFDVTIGGVDAFPSKRRARVIVVTLEKGVDKIKTIFNDIEDGLSTIGVEREKRELAPHITLGRRRTPAPLLEREIIAPEPMGFTVDKLVLFSSTLTPQGAVYAPVWGIPFTGGMGQESPGK
jgi:2'-5' RNA ligase